MRRLDLSSALAGSLALCLSASLAGQTPPPPSVSEQVLVTAERGPEERGVTPAAVSVLTREEVERMPAETLAELLEALPGLQILFAERSAGTVPMVGARGFFGGGEAEYVQLRVDGVAVGDVESGLADWRAIRATDIERIELLRGPASSLYGDTALGGVVQVFTRRLRPGQPRGQFALAGGSFGSAAAEGRWEGTLAGWSLDVSGGAFRTEGYRAHAASEESEARVGLYRAVGRDTWSFRLEGRASEREEPGALSRPESRSRPRGSDPLFALDREEGKRARAVASYRRDGTVGIRGTLAAASRQSDFVRTLLLAPGIGDRALKELSSATVTGAVEAEATPTVLGREARILFGLELGREWLHVGYRPVAEDGQAGARSGQARGTRDRLGGFLHQELNASERVRVTGGVRWDWIEESFGSSESRRDAWSPRVGLNVRLGALDRHPTSVFFVASRAFKAPTLDQLRDPRPFPDFQGGTFQLSNPALRPQRAWNLEAGVSRDISAARFDLSLYWMEVEDEIDFDPATLRYLNIGDSLHEGLEASVRVRAMPRLTASLAYAWTRAEPRSGEHRGKQLKNIPEHILRTGLDADLPAAWRASISWSLQAERFLDDGNTVALDDAATLDLRVERAFGRWKARLDLLNLTDARYPYLGFALPGFDGGMALYEYPAPGFSARAGLEAAF